MAVTGTILPKLYANVITRHEQKQTEDRKTFFISNIVSIVASPSKKTDQNKVNTIQDLLQCSRSSLHSQQKQLLQNVDI